MSILQLAQAKAESKAEALATIDKMRAQIESGECVGFIGATVTRGDSVYAWTATTEPISCLRMMGVLAHLVACYHSGDA